MKLNILKHGMFAVVLSLGLTSCDDFCALKATNSSI